MPDPRIIFTARDPRFLHTINVVTYMFSTYLWAKVNSTTDDTGRGEKLSKYTGRQNRPGDHHGQSGSPPSSSPPPALSRLLPPVVDRPPQNSPCVLFTLSFGMTLWGNRSSSSMHLVSSKPSAFFARFALSASVVFPLFVDDSDSSLLLYAF